MFNDSLGPSVEVQEPWVDDSGVTGAGVSAACPLLAPGDE